MWPFSTLPPEAPGVPPSVRFCQRYRSQNLPGGQDVRLAVYSSPFICAGVSPAVPVSFCLSCRCFFICAVITRPQVYLRDWILLFSVWLCPSLSLSSSVVTSVVLVFICVVASQATFSVYQCADEPSPCSTSWGVEVICYAASVSASTSCFCP